MEQLPTPAVEPGVEMIVTIEGEAFTLLRAQPALRGSRLQLHSPLLTPESVERLGSPADEIAVTILNRDGRWLDTFGWPAVPDAFVDQAHPRDPDGFLGGPVRVPRVVRLLRMPVPAEAAYLYFYRSTLTVQGTQIEGRQIPNKTFTQRSLALFSLLPQQPPPPTPIPPLPGPVPDPMPFPIPWPPPRKRLPHKPLDFFLQHLRAGGGYIDGFYTLVDSGPVADCFNVVILGDGFTRNEVSFFEDHAVLLKNGLLAMAPFNTLAGRINVHVVRTVSTDSGVTNCPGGPKRTYYEVTGDFKNQGAPGFFGTERHDTVWNAAELFAPLCDIHLMIMLVNCDINGGSADPEHRIAFVPVWHEPTRFINVSAHESAHVIIHAAEEYIGDEPPNPMEVYPNLATQAEKDADQIWWKTLALPAELNGGAFRTEHLVSDPFDAGCEPIVADPLSGMLGLYWGCQDVDDTLPGGVDPNCLLPHYTDRRGAPFYRGMARCKMRKSTWEFCRVCSHKLTEAIVAASVP